MKNLATILSLALVAFAASGQNYKTRQPYPAEMQRIAGLSEYIQDGPRYGIRYVTPNPEQIITNSFTNSIVIMESTGVLTNAFLQMGNPTNAGRYAIDVVARGNITVVLTTSNLVAANSAGPGFSTMTNVVATAYTMPTNSSARVICTGTNYLVVPGSK